MIGKKILFELGGKAASSLILFGSTLILARILTPEDFGIVASVMIIISIAETVVEVGFGSAIVQKLDISNEQLSTTFFVNILLGFSAFIAIFFSSEVIGNFYGNETIAIAAKLLSPIVLLASFSTIQTALLTKELKFDNLAVINTISALIAAGAGIISALLGYSFYSLIIQYLLIYLIRTLILWFTSKWIPKPVFVLSSIKTIWNYSSNIFFAQVINMTFSRLDGILIAKYFQISTLGFYNRAKSLNDIIVQYTSGSIGRVLFPLLSQKQNQINEFSKDFNYVYRILSLISILSSVFIFLLSDEIIIVLFSEKWLSSGYYLQILSVAIFFHNINFLISNALKAIGDSKIFLRIEVIKKVILITTFFIGLQYGLIGIIWAVVMSKGLSTVINLIVLKNKSIASLDTLFFISMKDLIFSIAPSCSIIILSSYLQSFFLLISSITSFALIIVLQHTIFPRTAIKLIVSQLIKKI